MSPYNPLRRLISDDAVLEFDCGHTALNQYLSRYALQNQQANSAQTYVCTLHRQVVGFYSLAVGSVSPLHAPSRITRGLANHEVPLMLLARLGVDKAHTSRGLGRALLKDALIRTTQASEIAGIRCLLVHAKDDQAREWYQQFDFEQSLTDPYHLFLLMKDIKAILNKEG